MKLYHLTLLFVIIFIGSIVITDIKTNQLKAVLENRKQIDRKLDVAIDDGVTSLAQVDGNNNIRISKDAAVKSFFLSLYSAFGILSDKEMQDKLNQYIPCVAVTMEDGFYVFYSNEFTANDGYTYIAKNWSEKFPYSYEDDDFIYCFTLDDVIRLYDKKGILEGTGETVYQMDYRDIQTKERYAGFRTARPESVLLSEEAFELVRKSTIISCIENTLAHYTSHHNKIAAQYGITYNFSLPMIREDEWAPYLDDISMFVVFQGYPYGNGTDEFYNRFVSAGAKMTKKKMYYLEQKNWYLIYHKETCTELNKEGIIFRDTPYYKVEDCAAKGAYACPICNQTGVFAPEYQP